MDGTKLRRKLLEWFKKNNRNHYPWRKTNNPYHLLVAEIMLQRTKADQVLPVYGNFLKRYPTISKLAAAEERNIAEIIHPLGLAWRAKNFKRAAVDVIEKYGGSIPAGREDLLKIRGIGDYVADSILYNAFNVRTSIIDSNVVRIIGRIFGIKTDAGSRRKKIIKELADGILPARKYREFNLAMLDLGAMICSMNPRCHICPVRTLCSFHNNGMEAA